MAGARPRCARSPRPRGYALAPRLTIYPEFVARPRALARPGLRFAVLDRSDAEGLGRDDPGAVFPETRRRGRTTSATAPRSCSSAAARRAWYSRRRRRRRRRCVPGPRAAAGGAVARGARRRARRPGGRRRRDRHAVRGPRAARSRAVAEVADELRRETVGDDVTCVRNRNINYTNVCTFKCRFCGVLEGPAVAQPARHAVPARRSTRSPSARRRGRASAAPPRSACRAASTPTSTATTTSTSPGR